MRMLEPPECKGNEIAQYGKGFHYVGVMYRTIIKALSKDTELLLKHGQIDVVRAEKAKLI